MSVWADFSFARPSLAELKGKGVVGVFRYLAPLPNKKVIDTTERDLILKSGLDLVLNWEWYEGRCNEGAGAGKADGIEAVRQAKALGYPAGRCLYFSHDTGVYDWQAIEAYFTAVRQVVVAAGFAIGAYGSFALIQFLHSKGLIDYGWQTKAWSTYFDPTSQTQRVRWEPSAVIHQDGTALVAGTDNDIISSPDIGSWLGGEMAVTLSADDKAWIQTALDTLFTNVKNDLTGTKLRVAADDPIVRDLDTRVAALQQAVASLPGGSADAKAVVDELGRRLNASA